jgi:3-hydroxyisobutyrate dehydrogenase
VLQSHIGAVRLKPDAERYLAADFAALLETLAQASAMRLKSEHKEVPTGLED